MIHDEAGHPLELVGAWADITERKQAEQRNWTAGGGGLKGMDDQKIFDVIAKEGIAIGKSKAMPAKPSSLRQRSGISSRT